MKSTALLSLILSLSASGLAIAQPAGMDGMDMGDKGMNMRDKGMQMKPNAEAGAAVHQATAVVESADAVNGKVTLAHEAVKSLQWPAKTMTFSVQDKLLFARLLPGKKVGVEFVQLGSDYVVTAVK